MIACVQYCHGSPLGNKEWRLSTHPRNIFDVEHRIYDLALDLAALYELDDSAGSSRQINSVQNINIILKLDAIVSSLHVLLEVLQNTHPAEASDPKFPYWDLESAIHVANILTLVLDASVTIQEICDRVRGIGEDTLVLPLMEKYSTERQQDTAERIMSALTYATGDDMGLYGAQKSLFALRKTLHNLPPKGLLYEQASEMYSNLMLRKGLQHTLDLNKEWGGLNHTGEE